MTDAQGTDIAIGLYGKHPSFGDFVTHGLTETAQSTLENWFNHVMPAIRDGWGDRWGPLFDGSPVIRFWFGGSLINEVGPLCGVIAPSRDTVGRRFPLVAAMVGADQPAPVNSGDQTIYDAMIATLRSYTRADGTGASDFAGQLQSEVGHLVPGPAAENEPDFWAARADGDLDRLWGDVSEVDHSRAATARSYLWCKGAQGAAVHVTRGLPGSQVLAWLMTDAVGGPEIDRPQTAEVAQAHHDVPAAVPMPTIDDLETTMPPRADNDNTVAPVEMPQATD